MQAGIPGSLEDLNKTEGRGRRDLPLASRLRESSPDRYPLILGYPSSSALGLGFTPLAPLVLMSLGASENYTVGSPGPPASRRQKWDFSASVIP